VDPSRNPFTSGASSGAEVRAFEAAAELRYGYVAQHRAAADSRPAFRGSLAAELGYVRRRSKPSMVIACLAWGSLVWDPRELPVRGKWFCDGPLLPVEFARQSKDGRLTLVLVPTGPDVRTFWALFSVDTVTVAREAVRKRECIPKKNLEKHVAVWSSGDPNDSNPASITSWARSLRLDAVVWTALPPAFNAEDRAPTEDEAVAYLRGLPHEQRRNAAHYIRMAPRQVDTPYRRRFELEFGWTPLSKA